VRGVGGEELMVPTGVAEGVVEGVATGVTAGMTEGVVEGVTAGMTAGVGEGGVTGSEGATGWLLFLFLALGWPLPLPSVADACPPAAVLGTVLSAGCDGPEAGASAELRLLLDCAVTLWAAPCSWWSSGGAALGPFLLRLSLAAALAVGESDKSGGASSASGLPCPRLAAADASGAASTSLGMALLHAVLRGLRVGMRAAVGRGVAAQAGEGMGSRTHRPGAHP
jgi:hypothetical protein